MGRKRKIATADTGLGPKLLPPCRVCEGPAGGFHYGVNTCEACKGFFHRSSKGPTDYRCDNDDNCLVNFKNQKICKKCRFAKCIEVGMAKDAIKTGRYTVEKRTQDTLELKTLGFSPPSPGATELNTESVTPSRVSQEKIPRQQKKSHFNSSDDNSQSQQSSSPDTSNETGSDSQQPVIDAFSITHNNLLGSNSDTSSTVSQSSPSQSMTPRTHGLSSPETNYGSSTMSSPPRMPQKNGNSPHSSFSVNQTPGDVSNVPFCSMSSASQSLPQHFSNSSYNSLSMEVLPTARNNYMPQPSMSFHGTLADAGNMSFSSKTVPDLQPETNSTSYVPLSGERAPMPVHNVSCTPMAQPYMGSPSYIQPHGMVSQSQEGAIPNSSLQFEMNQLNLDSGNLLDSPPEALGSDSGSGVVSAAPPCGTCHNCYDNEVQIRELYSDREQVVRILLDAKSEHIEHLLPYMSKEELQRKAEEHVETCRLRKEMFGSMTKIPDQEYDQIYASTGLDADGRLHRLGVMTSILEMHIRAQAKFAKCIPGFSLLGMEDQITLIKYSRSEMLHICGYHRVVPELNVVLCGDGKLRCDSDISNDLNFESSILKDYISLCQRFQTLDLTPAEKIVLAATVIMAPDRTVAVMCPKVCLIYEELNKLLIDLFNQRCDQPLQMFAQVINMMVRYRTFGHRSMKMVKGLRLDKYSNAMKSPLLCEMLGGLYFDEAEEAEEAEDHRYAPMFCQD